MNKNIVVAATEAVADDPTLLTKVTEAVHATGTRLLARYAADARPNDLNAMIQSVRSNEQVGRGRLQADLTTARPRARWVDHEQETTALPSGEWWAVDAVEGNVNTVHGLPEWSVNVTLLRDNIPILAVVYQPIGDLTYVAVRGGGVYLNDQPLHTSPKSRLDGAIVATATAEPGQKNTYDRIGKSITAMLNNALVVRSTVPSTFPLLLVASGQNDVFWQYEPVLTSIAAGALFVAEAGGIVSDIDGQPWRPGSRDFLAATPGLHAAAVEILSTVA